MEIEQIARICHQVNKSYCESIGDNSQLNWEDAPDWQKQSMINGVEFRIKFPDSKPSESHDNWLLKKEQDGWKYGPKKDEELKEHPCCVPYDELSQEQKSKDYISKSIVNSIGEIK